MLNRQEEKSDVKQQEIIFVMGGPGSGKGTHCKILAEKKGYQHISTGDLVRNLLATNDEIRAITQRGDLLNDELILQILTEEMKKYPDARGFLIDGYPRTIDQVKIFERDVRACDKILYLATSETEMQKRIALRNVTQNRIDDNDQTVLHRLQVYQQQTLPVIEYLREKYPQEFIHMESQGSITDVADKIVKQLSTTPLTQTLLNQSSSLYKTPQESSQPLKGYNSPNRPTYAI